jgi:hypothetical protein
MYTTLSPCDMCTGAILLYGIPRVVIGENETFLGGEDQLRSRGVEVVNLDLPECKALMAEFIARFPEVWNEDIGETDADAAVLASGRSAEPPHVRSVAHSPRMANAVRRQEGPWQQRPP